VAAGVLVEFIKQCGHRQLGMTVMNCAYSAGDGIRFCFAKQKHSVSWLVHLPPFTLYNSYGFRM
jgi:hypothetical protein